MTEERKSQNYIPDNEFQEENAFGDSLFAVSEKEENRGEAENITEEDSPFKIADDYKRLSPEEESIIAKKAASGEKDAIEKLILSNMRLVRSYVSKICKGLPFQDQEEVFQEGLIGLTYAANRFIPEKNTRFSTYATVWIKKYVQDFLIKKSKLSMSETEHAMLFKFYKAKAELEEENTKRGEIYPTPTIHDIAYKMNISDKQAGDLWRLSQEENQTSLNELVSQDDDEISLMDQISYGEDETPEYLFKEDEASEKLLQAISELDEKHKFVLERYLGINGKPKMSNVEIGKQLNVSSERARQILLEAIKKVKSKK